MTIKFNKSEKYSNAKKALQAIMSNENATEAEVTEAYENYFEALQNDVASAITKQVNNDMLDRSILQQRGQNVLTSEETKFFNEVVISGGFAEDSILPVTTQERVFDDLVKEHPLLEAIGLENLGAVTRYIDSDPTLAYVWGDLFGPIAGQIETAFSDEEVGSLKLTAFAVIPNDMLELGPEWVERYVRTLLSEAYSVGLEFGLVKGGGPVVKQPIGLLKDVNPDTGAVTDKASSGTLTFAPSVGGQVVAGELFNVISALSVDSKGKPVKTENKVVMVVNSTDAIAVKFRNTIQTANGQWVTNLPYNLEMVESDEVPSKKAVFFVKGRYKAKITGAVRIKKFDQTLAIEDATLYTMKQFANGKPKDNKAALVYDLNIDFAPTPIEPEGV